MTKQQNQKQQLSQLTPASLQTPAPQNTLSDRRVRGSSNPAGARKRAAREKTALETEEQLVRFCQVPRSSNRPIAPRAPDLPRSARRRRFEPTGAKKSLSACRERRWRCLPSLKPHAESIESANRGSSFWVSLGTLLGVGGAFLGPTLLQEGVPLMFIEECRVCRRSAGLKSHVL